MKSVRSTRACAPPTTTDSVTMLAAPAAALLLFPSRFVHGHNWLWALLNRLVSVPKGDSLQTDCVGTPLGLPELKLVHLLQELGDDLMALSAGLMMVTLFSTVSALFALSRKRRPSTLPAWTLVSSTLSCFAWVAGLILVLTANLGP